MGKRDRRERFVELAEKRVNRALKDIQLIGNLSNRSNYEYDEADVRKIHGTLRSALKDMKARFDRRAGDQDPEFKL